MRLDLDKQFKLVNFALMYEGKQFEGTLREFFNLINLDGWYADYLKEPDDEKISAFFTKAYHDLQYTPIVQYEPHLALLMPEEQANEILGEYKKLAEKITDISREYHTLIKEDGDLEKHVAESICINSYQPKGLVEIPCGKITFVDYYGWELDFDKFDDDPEAYDDEEDE